MCGLEREALFCMCEERVVECMSRERERGAMGFVCVREREALSILECVCVCVSGFCRERIYVSSRV